MPENTKMSNADLFKRKGKLIIQRSILLEADEYLLGVIFANFYPLDVLRYHEHDFWDSFIFFGVSPHFDVVDEACIAPEYIMILKSDEDGLIKFDKIEKRY